MAIGTGAAILGAGALGAAAGIFGSSQAAEAQENAANQASNTQLAMLQQQIALQEPFRQAGLTAQNRLLELLGLGGNAAAPGYGSLARDFSMTDFQTDPGYGFRMSEGMKALERSAAARGGLLSGATLKGVQRFGQDLASQEYQNAFNRYQVNRAARLNPLQSLMGAGQTSANVLTGATGQTGQGMAAAQQAAGAAQASGYVGGVNALTGALQSTVPNYMMYNFMNPGKTGGGGAPGLSPMFSGYGYT